jgi:serine/threonine kinase 16
MEVESSGRSRSHGGSKKVTFHDEITFDDGRTVIVCRLVSEGDFRHVFVARDSRSKDNTLYALKRINCGDDKKEVIEHCRQEAAIHRRFHHENLMPLLGMKFDSQYCYMLFPYIPRSLHDDITSRRLLSDTLESKRRPYSEQEALTLFSGIVSAVRTMHAAEISHRDIKIENVLLKKGKGKLWTPVLMDFGSAGPLIVQLRSPIDVLRFREAAERQTTISYRAPELGGEFALVYGSSTPFYHYGYADVWSLGCLLFAMLYGASPFEIEWRVSLVEGKAAEGTALVVDYNTQKVLSGEIPFPPGGTAADRRYDEDMKDVIRWMLRIAWQERPCITEVAECIDMLLKEENRRS